MNKIINEITLFVGLFSLFFILSFSFPFTIFPDVGGMGEMLFNKVVLLEARVLYYSVNPYHSGEDSQGMFMNVINILLITVLIYLPLTIKFIKDKEKVRSYVTVGIRYYLAIILLIYGFDKIYKWQFYSPESNILFTRVKDLPQDMLYWTTMGTSYSYSIFGGLMEVLAGGLLLFRKTYVLGATVSIAVLANVFVVNIGFDITVKLFSGFLLLLSLVLVLPYVVLMLRFFTGNKVQLQLPYDGYVKNKWYLPLKILVLALFILESQFKYFQAGNFNDDLAPRPHFNGAYDVLNENQQGIERIHFHRHGYFILELDNEQFVDYRLDVNEKDQQFVITDYSNKEYLIDFKEVGDTLKLYGGGGTFSVIAVKHEL